MIKALNNWWQERRFIRMQRKVVKAQELEDLQHALRAGLSRDVPRIDHMLEPITGIRAASRKPFSGIPGVGRPLPEPVEEPALGLKKHNYRTYRMDTPTAWENPDLSEMKYRLELQEQIRAEVKSQVRDRMSWMKQARKMKIIARRILDERITT